jgi:RHS repeat-associated protein
MLKISPNETTIFVYDAQGKLVAEYSNAPQGVGGTSYLTSDGLGMPRVVTSANGAVSARHDYLPFGEEIGAIAGGRSASPGYGTGDGIRQRFTSKIRDDESGLDYFEAGYYSSSLGRFTSADEFTGGPDELFDSEAQVSYLIRGIS